MHDLNSVEKETSGHIDAKKSRTRSQRKKRRANKDEKVVFNHSKRRKTSWKSSWVLNNIWWLGRNKVKTLDQTTKRTQVFNSAGLVFLTRSLSIQQHSDSLRQSVVKSLQLGKETICPLGFDKKWASNHRWRTNWVKSSNFPNDWWPLANLKTSSYEIKV